MLIASLVVKVVCAPLVSVKVIVCLGKSSITSCTAYGPSLLLLVGLNDKVQDCKQAEKEHEVKITKIIFSGNGIQDWTNMRIM